MVNNLAHPDKPVVALVTSLPINGDPAMQYRPWQVMQELGQFFDVRSMGGDIDRFADDVDVLMLVHPQALSEKTLYAIDQFVLRGGKVLVFVDPHSEAQAMRQQQGMPGDTFSNLEQLLPAWGIEYDPEPGGGRPAGGAPGGLPERRPRAGGRLPALARRSTEPLAPRRGGDRRAQPGQPRHRRLPQAARRGPRPTFTPLIRSSDRGHGDPADKVRLFPDPFALIRDFKPGGKALVLAARVGGPLKSAFGDKAARGDARAGPRI